MVKTCSYIPIHFQLEGGVKSLRNAEWVKNFRSVVGGGGGALKSKIMRTRKLYYIQVENH